MSTSASLTLEEGVARLAAIVGTEHIEPRGESVVAVPGDGREAAEVLRFANAYGLTVMPSGGGTKLGWGNPVVHDIELSLKRMCGLREHAWQDMTCTVEAGCPWAAMQRQLQQHGQMVALDPLWPDRATVGGIVACNDSGALRMKYGSLRDLIIGMTVVLADGTIAKSGGKVVKNVAGYDIHKLMTGSFGTLGVITQVNFRLHPAEEQARTWTAFAADGTCQDAGIFAEPLRLLLDTQMVPSCVQMRISEKGCALDVRVAALPECFNEYGDRIRAIMGKLAMKESGEEVWGARQRILDDNDALVLKISVLPGEICALTAELHQWAGNDGADVEVVAQATGLMTVGLKSAHPSAIAPMERLRARVHASGGSVVALQVPDELRGRIDVWGPDPGTLPLIREIKRRFDPGRVLNPGRFVGNI